MTADRREGAQVNARVAMDRYYADGAEEPQLRAYYAESAGYSEFVESDSGGGTPDWHQLAEKAACPARDNG